MIIEVSEKSFFGVSLLSRKRHEMYADRKHLQTSTLRTTHFVKREKGQPLELSEKRSRAAS